MNRRRTRSSRSQRMQIINAILVLIVIIVVLQLWLFTSTMNAFLGGDTTILLPAGLVSVVCLGLNLGLLWYLYQIDR